MKLNVNKYWSTNKYYNSDNYWNPDKYLVEFPQYYTRPDSKTVNELAKYSSYSPSYSFNNKRTNWDRIGDALYVGVYPIAGAVKNLIDDDESTTAYRGFTSGLKAANPFGEGYQKGETTWSDVLDTVGWQPITTGGKIARGVVGLVADVFLDPTTYLSGGVTGLLKGTGESGFKITHAAASAKAFEKYGVDISKGLTKDTASEIISKQALEKNITMTPEEVSEGAELLTRKYNEVVGIDRKAHDLTWSLGNAPFGNKIFGKAAEKKITLGTAEGIQKLSEKTIAPYYAALRDSIYGSQLAKLLPSKILYDASKKDPILVYDFIKFLDNNRGLTKDKLFANKSVREMAEKLGAVEPHQQKQLVELLQNKKVWHRVTEVFNVLDTQEGKHYWNEISWEKKKTSEYLDKLLENKQTIEDVIAIKTSDLNRSTSHLSDLEKSYEESLMNINLKNLHDVEDLDKVIYMYSEQIKKTEQRSKAINDEIEAVKNKYVEKVESISSDIDKTVKEREKLKQEAQVYVKQLVDLKNKQSSEAIVFQIKIKEISDKIDELKKIPETTRQYQPIIDKYDEMEKLSGVEANASRISFIENISTYLTGDKRFISLTTWKSSLDPIVNMMKQGKSQKEILQFIESNKDYYNGRAVTIFNFIGGQLGYGSGNKHFKNWNEFYTQRMDTLLKTQGSLSSAQKRILAELTEANYKRNQWLKQLTKMNDAELKKFLTDYANKQLEQDYKSVKQIANSTAKDFKRQITDEEVNRMKALNNEVAKEDKKFKLLYDDVLYNYKLDSNERSEIVAELTKNMKTSDGNINRTWLDWVNKVTVQIEPLLKDVFKRPYGQLTDGQKDLLIKMAYERVYKTNNKPKELTQIAKELKTRYIDARYKYIKQNVLEGSQVDIAGVKYTVKEISLTPEGKTTYKVVSANGDEITTSVGDITGIYKSAKPKTIDELIISSDMTKNYVDELDSLTTELKELQEKFYNTKDIDELIKLHNEKLAELEAKNIQLKNQRARLKTTDIQKQREIDELLQKNQLEIDDITAIRKNIDVTNAKKSELELMRQTQTARLTANFERHSNSIKKNIEELEESLQNFRNSLANKEFDKIDEMTDRLIELDHAMSSKDAFDTFMRREKSNDVVDNYITNQFEDLVKVVLKDDVDVDTQVRELAEVLRNQFVDIAREEMSIGKLTQEQFHAHMLDYLPHILTPEAEKHLIRDDVKKNIPLMGDDYGLGRVFSKHSKHRTLVLPDGHGGFIKNPTIEQINKHYDELLKGHNLFSDNISEIYLNRMLTHNDLMYDDAYMRDMLEKFGKDLNKNGSIDEGYKVVMNYGMMKDTVKQCAQLQISYDIDKAIKEHLLSSVPGDVPMTVLNLIERNAKQRLTGINYNGQIYDKIFSEEVQKEIVKFLKENYPPEKSKELYEDYLKSVVDEIGIARDLDDFAMPLVELQSHQTQAFENVYNRVHDMYLNNIHNKIIKFEVFQNGAWNVNNRAKLFESLQEQFRKMDVKQTREYINDLKQSSLSVTNLETISRWEKKLDKLETLQSPQIKQVHESIVQKANQARKCQIAKDQSRMLQLYDKMTHLIKLNQTTVMPAFHIRNKLSNTFNNWLVIGKDAVDPQLQKYSNLTLYHHGDVEKLKGMTVEIDGKQVRWSDLYQTALEYGVIDTGYFAKDIGVGRESKGVIKRLQPKHDPTDTKNFFIYKLGAEVGGTIESADRLLHFVAELRNGKSVREAAESVEKTLFDYSDLTAFEQNVMKRILPYYTWLRKNSALQLEMMLEHPEKYQYVTKFMGGIEGMVDDEDRMNPAFVNEFAQDWIQLPFEATNPQGRKEPILLNPNLPFMDFNRIPTPFDAKGSLINLFTQTNPLLKVPVEQSINKNMFFEQPIVDEGENQITNRLDHVLSNVAPYTSLKGFVTKDGLDLGLHTLNTVSGIKLLSYDYQTYKAMKLDEMFKKGNNINSSYSDKEKKEAYQKYLNTKNKDKKREALDRYLDMLDYDEIIEQYWKD